MEKLTIQEEEAMIYIWELGSCFVKDIVAKYPQPASCVTTLKILIRKWFLSLPKSKRFQLKT